MSKQEVIDRLNETLGRMLVTRVSVDPDGRLSKLGESELNIRLRPHGLRVACDQHGRRQDISGVAPTLRIEADGVECEHCAHGSNAHQRILRTKGFEGTVDVGKCLVEGCECYQFNPATEEGKL